MGTAASVHHSSATTDKPVMAGPPTPAPATPDNMIWILSSLKTVLPFLRLESVLCLHNVGKLLTWHVHNLGTWQLLCLRDFPNARSQFHDRILLSDSTAKTTDEDAKALYFELFCQRFIIEAKICLHSNCTGHISKQMNELIRHGDRPIPVTFKATVGNVPDSIPSFPALAPSETSSMTLEWIPRPGVELNDKNMDLLRRAFVFMAFLLTSDPKDGPIQPGSGAKGGPPRVVMSRGTTAEGDPVVVSSFNFQNGSEAWKRTRKGSRGAFQQVWKLFKRHVWQRRRSKTNPNNYGNAAEHTLRQSYFMFALLKFLRQTRHLRRRAQKRARGGKKTNENRKDAVGRRVRAKNSPLELKLHMTRTMLQNEVRVIALISMLSSFKIAITHPDVAIPRHRFSAIFSA